jgi:hypothetical protein
VVDESAEGMMIECPQCRINVIVPPQTQPASPPGSTSAKTDAPARPTEATKPTAEITGLHDRLNVLASQLREQQTQWAEVTNRIATHINEVNRELIALSRLETSHKQILKEWNQLVGEIAAASRNVAQQPLPTPPKQ